MGMAFYYAPYGEAQWRGPLGIALIWPVMMLIIIALPFVPESPRYLLMRGRIEEARAVTMKLHAVKNDPDQEFARAEFYQMSKQTEFDRTLDPSWVCASDDPASPPAVLIVLNPDRDVPSSFLPQANDDGDGLCVRWAVNGCAGHQQLR